MKLRIIRRPHKRDMDGIESIENFRRKVRCKSEKEARKIGLVNYNWADLGKMRPTIENRLRPEGPNTTSMAHPPKRNFRSSIYLSVTKKFHFLINNHLIFMQTLFILNFPDQLLHFDTPINRVIEQNDTENDDFFSWETHNE